MGDPPAVLAQGHEVALVPRVDVEGDLEALRARGIVTTARVSEARSLTPLVAPLISPYTRGEGTPIRTMPTLADLLTPCADGEVTFSFVQESEWQRFATLIGQPEWGEYFRGYQTRRENWEAIVELAAPWLNIRGKREIFDLCQAARVPCGMVQQPADVLAHEQLAFRQFFQTLDTPSVGKTVIAPGLPWQSRCSVACPRAEQWCPPRPLVHILSGTYSCHCPDNACLNLEASGQPLDVPPSLPS